MLITLLQVFNHLNTKTNLSQHHQRFPATNCFNTISAFSEKERMSCTMFLCFRDPLCRFCKKTTLQKGLVRTFFSPFKETSYHKNYGFASSQRGKEDAQMPIRAIFTIFFTPFFFNKSAITVLFFFVSGSPNVVKINRLHHSKKIVFRIFSQS